MAVRAILGLGLYGTTFFMLFFVNNVFKQDVGGDRTLIAKTEKIATPEIVAHDSVASLSDSTINSQITNDRVKYLKF